MSPLHQFRRLRADDGSAHLVEKSLRPGTSEGSEACAICRATMFSRGLQRGPVVVSQPERHLDMKDIEQFDEVIRPSGRHGARTHGVLERQVPADDPREQFAQCRIGVCISASRQRNHGGEFGIAESGKGASEARQDERRA